MGYMKELDIRIRNGGDDAIAAACELAGLAKERRGYEDVMNATEDITDIVTVLRGVGFSAVSPQAGDSASLLHYWVTHAADEIERLRSQPCPHVTGTVTQHCTLTPFTLTDEEREAIAACAAACENAAQYGIAEDARRASTLRGLLERAK